MNDIAFNYFLERHKVIWLLEEDITFICNMKRELLSSTKLM